jgi:hypothetical protein
MKTFDLYGFSSMDLEGIRRRVEDALGVVLDPHESSYQGGIYFRYGALRGEHLVLKRNFDHVEHEWAEESFKAFDVLLYVNETCRGDEMRKVLSERVPEASLLRRDQSGT